MRQWHTLPTGQVLKELSADPVQGLSHPEAAQRLQRHGVNRLDPPRARSPLLRFLDQMKDPMILVLLGAAVLSLVSGRDPIYQLLSGGLMLGAFFMATDYVTSPTTTKGKIVFGLGLGVITCAIRFLGTMNEGVSFAILLMNLLVPYIEILTRQDRLGIAKTKKKEGAAK